MGKHSSMHFNKSDLYFSCSLRGIFSRQISRSEATWSPPQWSLALIAFTQKVLDHMHIDTTNSVCPRLMWEIIAHLHPAFPTPLSQQINSQSKPIHPFLYWTSTHMGKLTFCLLSPLMRIVPKGYMVSWDLLNLFFLIKICDLKVFGRKRKFLTHLIYCKLPVPYNFFLTREKVCFHTYLKILS